MKDGLTDAEARLWWLVLLSGHKLQTTLNDALRRSHSLDHLDFRFLVRLSASPDHSLRMSDLASFASIESSLVTYRIKGLERLGFVTRESRTDDGRGVNARLTDDGLRLVHEIAPQYATMVRRLLLDDLDDADRRVFERVFERLWEKLARDLWVLGDGA